MSRRRDPIVRAARLAALGVAALDAALGLAARERPDLLHRYVGFPPGAQGFYRRWGAQVFGFTGVQTLAAVWPSPTTFTAAATVHAVEIGADYAASREPDVAQKPLHVFGAAANVGLVLLFAAAAIRTRRRGHDDA